MGESEILVNQRRVVGKWVYTIRILKVTPSKKFPEGIKAKYNLIDLEKDICVFLVDNHDELSFHYHPELPENHDCRLPLNTTSYKEALEFFLEKIKEIMR